MSARRLSTGLLLAALLAPSGARAGGAFTLLFTGDGGGEVRPCG